MGGSAAASPHSVTAGPPRRSRRALWLWLGYWAALFTATHTPVPPGLPVARFTDKVAHFFLYLLLTVLAARWYALAEGPAPVQSAPLRSLIAWASVFILYAAFDEWLQQFVGRSMSAGDFAADVVGVVAATAILVRRRLVRPISPAPGGASPE